jgi:UDP-N-acetylmuramate-alanine ligase
MSKKAEALEALEELKTLVEKLAKLKSKNRSADGENDNIAECSIRLEHMKYGLAQKLSRSLLLTLTNVALISQCNIYAAAGQMADGDTDKEKIMEQMREANESMLEGLSNFLDDIKEDAKDE